MKKPRRSLTDRHMTRLEMLKAAGHESDSTGHLSICAECREAVELLRQFHLAGRPPLPDPPKAWVERATAIPSSRWPRRASRARARAAPGASRGGWWGCRAAPGRP